jgi:hypothetical protein
MSTIEAHDLEKGLLQDRRHKIRPARSQSSFSH